MAGFVAYVRRITLEVAGKYEPKPFKRFSLPPPSCLASREVVDSSAPIAAVGLYLRSHVGPSIRTHIPRLSFLVIIT